jgi:FkbH-like protein
MDFLSFQELKKNLKKDFSGHKSIKLAVLGDSATQLYVQAIKGYGYEAGLHFDIFEADYDQIERQAFDPTSELYSFSPDFVVVFYCTNKLLKKFGKLSTAGKTSFSQQQVKNAEDIYQAIISRIKCKVIFFNFPEINDSVFGNYADKTSASFIYQLRSINLELMNLALKLKNFFILDLNVLQSQYGHRFVTDNKIYINTDLLFSLDFIPIVAKNTIEIIQSITGVFNKCLILDLDNTLWGGIIGDDGMENIQIGDLGIGRAFSELQLWIKQLRQRGIILAICSKNDEDKAREPFEKHPDMILRLEDIAVFVANWNNKADNIRYIQRILNIGFDSMVFLDDNPFERNMVRSNIPLVTVPELPEDPAEYLNYLRTLNLFETASFTEEDEQRTLQYQEEASRTIIQQQFTNEADFLKALEMVSLVQPFNTFNTPRVSQLTQRSNQFNLRTVRYTEEEIQKIAGSPDFITLAFSLRDKFGDYGLISLIVLHKRDQSALFIDTWIMSCRVLKRNMENFVLNTIVERAKEGGFNQLLGEYLPTAKNNMVKDHYQNLGFAEDGNLWKLQLESYDQKPCFIKSITES